MTTKATTKRATKTKATKVKPVVAKVKVPTCNFIELGAAARAAAKALTAAGYKSDGGTHEAFVHSVRDLAVKRIPTTDGERKRLEKAKLCYGMGMPGLRGVTVFGTWQNGGTDDFIEICAAGEESATQLAGTTIHELAHCLAGHKAGHGKEWKEACERLGLRCAKAAGHRYSLAGFTPDIRAGIAELAVADGLPMFGATRFGVMKPRPCSMGIGTRGGTSRGVGSGSRLRKYVCQCGQIIRAATDELEATHGPCGTAFARAEADTRKAA
jgi:hypothetical protein